MGAQRLPVIMLVSQGIPTKAIADTKFLIRNLGHRLPQVHYCNPVDVLEDIQRYADDPDPEISTDGRLAFKSATTADYDRVWFFLGRPGDIDESFQMPACIRHCFIYGSDGQVTLWEPVAA